MKKKASLAVRVAVLVSVLVAALIGLVLLAIGIILQNDIYALMSSENIQIARARSSQIDQLIETHFRELSILALEDAVTKGSPVAAEAAIQAMNGKVSPDISTVLLGWPDGRGTTPKGVYVDISQRPYFQAIMGGGKDFSISDALVSKAAGKPALILAKAIAGATGRPRALIGFEMQLSALSQITNAIKLGATGYGWVLDENGLVIADPTPEAIMKLNAENADKEGYRGLSALSKRMLAEPEGTGAYSKPDGTAMLCYWTRVQNSPGWTLALSVTRKEANATLDSIGAFIAAILCIGLILAVALAILLARSLARPIKVVDQAMSEIAKGDLVLAKVSQSERDRVTARGDEIGNLGRSDSQGRQSARCRRPAERHGLGTAGEHRRGTHRPGRSPQGGCGLLQPRRRSGAGRPSGTGRRNSTGTCGAPIRGAAACPDRGLGQIDAPRLGGKGGPSYRRGFLRREPRALPGPPLLR